MKLTEKMSYLKGYIDAIDANKDSKEWQVISKMTDLMDEMVVYIEDLQSQVDELSELCEILDEDLGEVEEEVFNVNLGTGDAIDVDDDDDFDEDFDDEDQLYEATCPTCGRTIILDEDMLEEGGVECACGESLEFDFEGLDEEELDEKGLENALDSEMLEDLEQLDSLDTDE
jgi:hypothetical protein